MVDDDIHIINLFKECFEYSEITLDYETNGIEGAYKALENKYDLIIMDINMPLNNGIEATQKIRALESKHNFICAFTSNPELSDIKEKNLFDAVLPKENATLLLKTVRTILKNTH